MTQFFNWNLHAVFLVYCVTCDVMITSYRNHKEETSDPLIKNGLTYLCKIVHDSLK